MPDLGLCNTGYCNNQAVAYVSRLYGRPSGRVVAALAEHITEESKRCGHS